VNGARDLSQRLAEKAEYERRLQEVKEKWHRAVMSIRRPKKSQATGGGNEEQEAEKRAAEQDKEMFMYQEAVKEALEKDDKIQNVSPFIIARLAVVLRKEYQAHRLEKFVDRLHDEQKSFVNWVCEGVQATEGAKEKTSEEGKRQILKTKLELEQNSMDHTKQCRSILQQRRQAILQRLDQMQQPSLIMESDAIDPVAVQELQTPTPSFDEKGDIAADTKSTSSEWLEEIINEDYFPASPSAEERSRRSSDADATASDWVICGY
ncbi:MAG: hypothetical protein SGARI_001301, partial [Bacillariaceae sp.]